jgi:O-antigen/teichoic acid export membrane protein
LVEAASAALSVIIAAPFVWRYGIEGAAWAVPVYFGAQLLLAAARGRRAWRQGQRPLATPTTAATSTSL